MANNKHEITEEYKKQLEEEGMVMDAICTKSYN